nr:uncharacterized protein LOC129453783 isoform X2 [Misgurnus anguillicaudatus]
MFIFSQLMKNMNHSLFVLLCLLWCLNGAPEDSCHAIKTAMNDTHIPDIPTPNMVRDFSSSIKNCVIKCSVSSVTQANLLWYNGSGVYTSLKITDLNTRLYLEVDYQDKNNYSCVVSSSVANVTLHLNITKLCQQPCSDNISTLMPVSEGESFTLSTNLTKLQDNDFITWYYINKWIAQLQGNKTEYKLNDRFNNRLQLDINTGALTITNTSKIHSGLYKLLITNGAHQKCLNYNVTVYDRLPTPIITNDSTQCSSENLKCVVMCSVNVTHMTLSWYNGSRLHSSINVSDLKRSNFLCLVIEYQDNNTYSCVVNNSFTNKTTQLNKSALCNDHSQPSNYTDIKIGASVGGVFAFIVFVGLVCCCYNKKFPCQKDTSEDQQVANTPGQANDDSADQEQTSSTSAQNNAGAGTSGNNPEEDTPLIDQPSSSSPPQESVPFKQLCCK